MGNNGAVTFCFLEPIGWAGMLLSDDFFREIVEAKDFCCWEGFLSEAAPPSDGFPVKFDRDAALLLVKSLRALLNGARETFLPGNGVSGTIRTGN